MVVEMRSFRSLSTSPRLFLFRSLDLDRGYHASSIFRPFNLDSVFNRMLNRWIYTGMVMQIWSTLPFQCLQCVRSNRPTQSRQHMNEMPNCRHSIFFRLTFYLAPIYTNKNWPNCDKRAIGIWNRTQTIQDDFVWTKNLELTFFPDQLNHRIMGGCVIRTSNRTKFPPLTIG